MALKKSALLIACWAGCVPAVAQEAKPAPGGQVAEAATSLYPADRAYLRERLELMRRTQVPDFDRVITSNGWPAFTRAVSASRGAVVFAASSPVVKQWVEDGGSNSGRSSQDLLDAAAGLRNDATPELIAEGRRFLDQFNSSNLAFELDALSNEVAFVASDMLESPAMLHLLPHLGDARQAARLCAARISYASIAGDEKALIRAFTNMQALAKACSHEGYMISSLVSNAIDNLACQRLTEVLAARPVSAATLRELLNVTEGSSRADWAVAIDGERLCTLDTLNWVYVTSNYKLLEAMQSSNGKRITDGIVGKLKSWGYAPREEALSKVDSYFLAIKPAFDADPVAAAAATSKAEGIAKEVNDSARLAPAAILIPTLVRAVQVERTTRTMRAGLRIVLAAEIYKAEQGKLPESIDDLAATIGKAPLVDWEDPARLPPRYAKRDGAPGYVVYSVGRDGTDNRGTRDAANQFGEPGKNEAADFILSWVEPPAGQ